MRRGLFLFICLVEVCLTSAVKIDKKGLEQMYKGLIYGNRWHQGVSRQDSLVFNNVFDKNSSLANNFYETDKNLLSPKIRDFEIQGKRDQTKARNSFGFNKEYLEPLTKMKDSNALMKRKIRFVKPRRSPIGSKRTARRVLKRKVKIHRNSMTKFKSLYNITKHNQNMDHLSVKSTTPSIIDNLNRFK